MKKSIGSHASILEIKTSSMGVMSYVINLSPTHSLNFSFTH